MLDLAFHRLRHTVDGIYASFASPSLVLQHRHCRADRVGRGVDERLAGGGNICIVLWDHIVGVGVCMAKDGFT